MLHKQYFLKAIAAGVLVISACTSQVYNNKAFLASHNISGQRVAILPVEVEFTGRLPKDLSLDKKLSGEVSESTQIQDLIYSQYLYKSRKRKDQKEVRLMNVEQVNEKLKSRGISIRDSWAISADSLGKIVGADLVLRARVKKDRIMSESASFGIGVATTILGSIINGNTNSAGNGVSIDNGARTYTINLEAAISDVKTGTVISKFSREDDASWKQSPESIIKDTNKKIVRKAAIYTR